MEEPHRPLHLNLVLSSMKSNNKKPLLRSIITFILLQLVLIAYPQSNQLLIETIVGSDGSDEIVFKRINESVFVGASGGLYQVDLSGPSDWCEYLADDSLNMNDHYVPSVEKGGNKLYAIANGKNGNSLIFGTNGSCSAGEVVFNSPNSTIYTFRINSDSLYVKESDDLALIVEGEIKSKLSEVAIQVPFIASTSRALDRLGNKWFFPNNNNLLCSDFTKEGTFNVIDKPKSTDKNLFYEFLVAEDKLYFSYSWSSPRNGGEYYEVDSTQVWITNGSLGNAVPIEPALSVRRNSDPSRMGLWSFGSSILYRKPISNSSSSVSSPIGLFAYNTNDKIEENILSDLCQWMNDPAIGFTIDSTFYTLSCGNVISITHKNGAFQASPFINTGNVVYMEPQQGNWLSYVLKSGDRYSLHLSNTINNSSYVVDDNIGQFGLGAIVRSTGLFDESTGSYLYPKFTPENGREVWLYKNDKLTCVNSQRGAVKFEIYPNPTAGAFSIAIKCVEKSQLIITDLYGDEVYSKEIGGTDNYTEQSIEHLSQGVYFVTVFGDNWSETKKVVVVN